MSSSAAGGSASTTPRRDPTQTTTQRNRLGGRLSSRSRDVRGQTRQQVQGQAQAPQTNTATIAAAGLGGLAAFRTLGAFRRWLSGLFDSLVLDTTPPAQVRRGQHWTASFVRESYATGLRQARAALRAQGYDVSDRTVEALITDERHQRALAALYERGYHDLEDAVDNTVGEVSRTVADGGYIGEDVAGGDVNKSELVSTLNERLDANYGKRVDHLGDSIPVKSANRAALTEYDHAGVEQVGVEPEADPDAESDDDGDVTFQTSQDRFVCEECREIAADNPYALSEVPIPVVDTHPHCRCFILAI